MVEIANTGGHQDIEKLLYNPSGFWPEKSGWSNYAQALPNKGFGMSEISSTKLEAFLIHDTFFCMSPCDTFDQMRDYVTYPTVCRSDF